MIIDINYLLDYGLPVSDEISSERLERAIFTAEQVIVKPRLGDYYIAITDDPDEYYDILNGGPVTDGDKSAYLAGLKPAMAHLAFAVLLNQMVNATAFSSVIKTEEYSEPADDTRLRQAGMNNAEIGLQYLREITDWLKIDNTDKNLPNIIWSEFL